MRNFNLFTWLCLFCLSSSALAQYQNYGMFQFAEPRINPANLTSGKDATLSFLYRNQKSMPGVEINSSYLNAKYPFLRRKSAWSAIGIELSSGREGLGGLFETNGIGAGYGLYLPIDKLKSLSFGISLNYFQLGIDTRELSTGNQFVANYGFDPNLDLGENLNQFKSHHLSSNLGIKWQKLDRKKRAKDHLGLAFYNLNIMSRRNIEPEASPSPVIFIAEGVKRIYENRQWIVSLDGFGRLEQTKLYWSLGSSAIMDLRYFNYAMKGQSIAVSIRYLHYEGILSALKWNHRLFSLGASYQLPFQSMIAQDGIYEIGVTLKKHVIAKRKRYKKRRKKAPVRVPQEADLIIPKPKESMERDSIEVKPSSLAQHDRPINRPVITAVDTAQVHFLYLEFDFGSAVPTISKENELFLDQMALKLMENSTLSIEIIGHTDDVGSRFFNQTLSEERALSVYMELVKRGVDETQITYYGEGESMPIKDNSNIENRASNRRVEIRFMDEEW